MYCLPLRHRDGEKIRLGKIPSSKCCAFGHTNSKATDLTLERLLWQNSQQELSLAKALRNKEIQENYNTVYTPDTSTFFLNTHMLTRATFQLIDMDVDYTHQGVPLPHLMMMGGDTSHSGDEEDTPPPPPPPPPPPRDGTQQFVSHVLCMEHLWYSLSYMYRDFATVMSLLQRGLMLYTSSSQLYIRTCRGRVQCHFAHAPADTDVDCVLSLFKANICFLLFSYIGLNHAVDVC